MKVIIPEFVSPYVSEFFNSTPAKDPIMSDVEYLSGKVPAMGDLFLPNLRTILNPHDALAYLCWSIW